MTTAPATRPRKPAAKPARTLSYDPEAMTLCLFRGSEGTAFAVFELPCVEGGRRVFRVGKYDLSEKYTVSVKAGVPECDCKGGVYAGRCKHGDALKSLIQLGKL